MVCRPATEFFSKDSLFDTDTTTTALPVNAESTTAKR